MPNNQTFLLYLLLCFSSYHCDQEHATKHKKFWIFNLKSEQNNPYQNSCKILVFLSAVLFTQNRHLRKYFGMENKSLSHTSQIFYCHRSIKFVIVILYFL